MDTSLKNLEEALSIRRQIDTLENRLTSLLGAALSRSEPKASPRKMSPQARAKIAAAMRARGQSERERQRMSRLQKGRAELPLPEERGFRSL
jgi:hypothetical protein